MSSIFIRTFENKKTNERISLLLGEVPRYSSCIYFIEITNNKHEVISEEDYTARVDAEMRLSSLAKEYLSKGFIETNTDLKFKVNLLDRL